MSRVVVIGATGHIGTYLVPRLVAGGHDGPGGGRRAGHVRRADRGAAPRGGHRPHLLHRPGNAEVTREHTFRSVTASIARAREVLGYAPRYTALAALREALAWLVANGQADIGDQSFPEMFD